MGALLLTDPAVRKAVPRDKAYKLADAGGLYLFVMPSGGRSWRYKYRSYSARLGKLNRARARSLAPSLGR